MINTKHFGNSDFAYRMYFVENSGVLTPVLSIRNFDVPYENLAGGLSYLSTFIGNNFYFTGTFNNVGEELLVINFDTVLNINDFETFNSSEKFEFTLYPNPTNTMLNIKSSSAIKSGIIYNLLGKKISEINTNSIDVSRFQSGIYILKLEDELGNIYSKKWIKQ